MTIRAVIDELSWREAALIRQMNGDVIAASDFKDAARLKEIGLIQAKDSGFQKMTELG